MLMLTFKSRRQTATPTARRAAAIERAAALCDPYDLPGPMRGLTDAESRVFMHLLRRWTVARPSGATTDPAGAIVARLEAAQPDERCSVLVSRDVAPVLTALSSLRQEFAAKYAIVATLILRVCQDATTTNHP